MLFTIVRLVFFDLFGLWATPPGDVVLSSCKTGQFNFIRDWGGVGFTAGITLGVRSRNCDCCSDDTGFVEGEWSESNLTGSIELGLGIGIEHEILGWQIDFSFHAADIIINLVDISLVSSSCCPDLLSAGNSLSLSLAPTASIGAGPAGVSAGGGLVGTIGYGVYVSNSGFGLGGTLNLEATLWYELQLWMSVRFNLPGYPKLLADKSGGVDCLWTGTCTPWSASP